MNRDARRGPALVHSAATPPAMPDAIVDLEDLAAYRAGDEEAFARLYARHSRQVFATARRFAPARDAGDVAQEAWLLIARRFREDSEIRNVRGLVGTVAVGEGIRYATRDRGSVVPGSDVVGSEALQGLKASGKSPEEYAIDRDFVEIILAGLDGDDVTPRQAEALRARVIGEETLAEIAVRLGVSHVAALQLARRAGVKILRRLRGAA